MAKGLEIRKKVQLYGYNNEDLREFNQENINKLLKSSTKKGVNKSQIQNNLNLMKQDNENWELESARIFAKKKKLLEKNESYEKKLAKMARAGFSYDICKKILS